MFGWSGKIAFPGNRSEIVRGKKHRERERERERGKAGKSGLLGVGWARPTVTTTWVESHKVRHFQTYYIKIRGKIKIFY